jgi:protein disulfide-isomerase A1
LLIPAALSPSPSPCLLSLPARQSLPAVSQITASNHDEFKGSDKVVLISYTPAGTDAPKAFTAYANAHRDSYLFGHTNDPSALSLASISSSSPSIVLYKSFDEGSNTLPPSTYTTLTAESLGAWIKIHAMPLLDEISPENFALYAQAGIPIAYTFVDHAEKRTNKPLLESLRSIAAEYKGKISFVSIDAVKFVDHAKSLNLPGDVWPAFAIQDLAAQTKYPLKAGSVAWDAKTVKEFVRSFEKGEIKPDVKSAPVPTQTESVWELVSDEYDKVVYEDGNDKDVFIEFFAPWCGHWFVSLFFCPSSPLSFHRNPI